MEFDALSPDGEKKLLPFVSEESSQHGKVEENLSLIKRLEQMEVADKAITAPMSGSDAIACSVAEDIGPPCESNDGKEDIGADPPMPESRSHNDGPIAVTYFVDKQITELSRYAWRGCSKRQRYLNGCLWSPDGTCILTAVNWDGMHVVDLPADVYENESVSPDRPLDVLQSAVHVKEAGLVYDYCWYPYMNSAEPASCVWLASRRHEPVQMWDAYEGTLRCSYRGYSAVDEVATAISLTFSHDGCDIIAGYRDSLKIFRTDVPGRDYVDVPLIAPASALAVNPNDDTIAIGTWTGSFWLHDKRHPKTEQVYNFNGHRVGITYLRFIAQRNLLVSGARKDSDLLIWDMRNTSAPVHRLARTVGTNQCIYFDVSGDEKLLVSGDTTGIIHAWDIRDFAQVEELTVSLTKDKRFSFFAHTISLSSPSLVSRALRLLQWNLVASIAPNISNE